MDTTMQATGHGNGPGNRLGKGAAILAAAHLVDTAPVKLRLSRFLTAHRGYVGAQGKVDAAESDLRAAQAKVARREIEVDQAVETLALALANGGHSRTQPFAAFGAVAPAFVNALAIRNKVEAIHQLVDRVQHAAVSQKSRASARAADQAARSLAAALLPV